MVIKHKCKCCGSETEGRLHVGDQHGRLFWFTRYPIYETWCMTCWKWLSNIRKDVEGL